MSMSSNHPLSLSLSEVLKSIVSSVQRFCSNPAIKRETNSYPYSKSLARISRDFFSQASTRPTGLCDVVDNSTSLSSEKNLRACGKMHREELSLIWGRRDEIGGRISSAA